MSKIFTKVLTTLSMIWQIIIDFLKLLSDWLKKKLLMHYSRFLTAYHYSLGVFFPAKDTKAGAIEGCQTWMYLTLSVTECMSSLDIYVSLKPEAIKIPKLCVFLIVNISSFRGCSTWISSRSCGMKKQSVQCTLPLFHLQYASHSHLLEEWF